MSFEKKKTVFNIFILAIEIKGKNLKKRLKKISASNFLRSTERLKYHSIVCYSCP